MQSKETPTFHARRVDFQEEDAHCLGAHVAVRCCVQRLAAALRGQHACERAWCDTSVVLRPVKHTCTISPKGTGVGNVLFNTFINIIYKEQDVCAEQMNAQNAGVVVRTRTLGE
jgi:hypothetical protein